MYYIGIDLGGTNIAVGLVDEKFDIVYKDSVPTMAQRPVKEIVEDMIKLSKEVLAHENVDISDVVSIGIGSPGLIDRKNGIIVYANNINMKNTPVKEWIQQEINLPVYIENDANAAALGEAYAGATKNVNDSVMITIGTGIGGGVILGKKIYSGFNGNAAELGHTVIVLDGKTCSCGRDGCWEAYASATALISQTVEAAKNNPDSILSKTINGKYDEVNGKTAFDAMRNGCSVGKKVVDTYIKYLGAGIADMITIFRPEIIVIGGGVSKEGETLLKPLIEYVEKNTYGGQPVGTQIKIAKLGNDAGIIGAAALGVK